ncbi:Inosose dehydratase [Baekduia alba]|uniref:sugar phosphate isomerase/epimerase family protein n=1 Tax=Baekduia alba TaxID=2997333 RepID=UPI0023425BC0|nr:sugar phosphate isomerase/epimerase [Baekduia alba]WCB94627.1 Inosose dehydratase [Baekduia alba]
MERRTDTAVTDRLVGAPISWGVCEVPGWGLQLTPDRVLAEMAALGLRHTELGALGWLPLDGAQVKRQLADHGLDLVGGFVPVVVHEDDLSPTIAHARAAARQLADAGASLFVAALVTDLAWSAPVDLDDAGWARLGEHLATITDLVADEYDLELVLHPHVGTLVETAAQVDAALAHTDVSWCFDSGHLLIGGTDPVAFVQRHAERIAHVHLKDVDATLAAQVRDNTMTLVQATQHGLFRPLGAGDARIDDVVALLDESGYGRWLVLEQDLAITGSEPPADAGPALDVRRSIEFLSNSAPWRERVSQS